MKTNRVMKMVLKLLALSSILFPSVAVNAQPATFTFKNPEYRGNALDWCLVLGNTTQCGEPVANLYCEVNGYERAYDFRKAENVGKCTKIISDKQVYCGSDADSFQYISCTKG